LKYGVKINNPDICDKALNGLEALTMVIANVEQNHYQCCDYDLILMDCNMPFMDGYEACHKIRQFLWE
jgi:CheY-like chemotaxis protein